MSPDLPVVDRKSLKNKKRNDDNGEAGADESPRKDHQCTGGSDEAVCRICWGVDGETPDGQPLKPGEINPLISPCKCTGTMGHIHLKCLRGWLQTKRTKKEHRKQVVFKFKKLDCELCKTAFPFKISYNNNIVDIVDVERPDKNYIVLESLSQSGNNNEESQQKIFYVINTADMKATDQSSHRNVSDDTSPPVLPGQ